MAEDAYKDKTFQYLVHEIRKLGVGNKFSGNPKSGRRMRWTQEAIGEITGIDQRSIRDWEKCKVWPDQDKVQQFIARLEDAPGRSGDQQPLSQDEHLLLDALWDAFIEGRGNELVSPKNGAEEVEASDIKTGSTQNGPGDARSKKPSGRLRSVWDRLHWPAITGIATVAAVVVGLLGIWASKQDNEITLPPKPEPIEAAREHLRVLAYPQNEHCLFWGYVVGYDPRSIEVAFDYGGVEKLEPNQVFEATNTKSTEAERLAVRLPLEGSSVWIESAVIETEDGQLQAIVPAKVPKCTEGLRGQRFNVAAQDVFSLRDVGDLK